MFKLMKRFQTPVLVIAGGVTALLFGVGDMAEHFVGNPEARIGNLSAEERADISRKLKLQAILSGRNVPNDRWELFLEQYSKNLKKANEEKLKISDVEIQKFIIDQFKNKDQYKKVQQQLNESYGVSAQMLEEYFRDQLLFQKSAKMKLLGSYVTSKEIKEEFHRRYDKISFDQIKVKTAKIELDAEIKEEELKNFYEEKSNELKEFQIPERVKIKYLYVETDSVTIDKLEDDDIRQYYNLNRDKYPSQTYPGEVEPFFEVENKVKESLSKEKREDKAKKLLNTLDDLLLEQENPNLSKTLEEAQKKYSEMKAVQVGESKAFAESDYMIEPLGYVFNLAKKLFGENVRSYGSILESSNGFYIYHLSERLDKDVKSYEESVALIKEKLSTEKKEEKAKMLAEEWKDKLVNSTDWGSIDLKAHSALAYSLESEEGVYGDVSKKCVENGLEKVSDVLESDGDYVIVKLRKREPADEAKLESLKEEIQQSLSQQKVRDIQFAEMTIQ